MSHKRLTHLGLLHCHRQRAENIDIERLCEDFAFKTNERRIVHLVMSRFHCKESASQNLTAAEEFDGYVYHVCHACVATCKLSK